jgi:hypothetical protein
MSYVYAITNKSTILYIGKSGNPKNRMREHIASILNKSHNEPLNKYKSEELDFYILYEGADYSQLEEQLIGYELPPGNRQVIVSMMKVDQIQRAKKIISDREAWIKLDKDTELTTEYKLFLPVELSSKLNNLLKKNCITLQQLLEDVANNPVLYGRMFAGIPVLKKSRFSDEDMFAAADEILGDYTKVSKKFTDEELEAAANELLNS